MIEFLKRCFTFLLVAIATLTSVSTSASASPLSDELAWWQPPQAFLCQPAGFSFPSKYSASDPDHCDDGDMTLFNGMLCSSDDARGCDAVRGAQGSDGRWWRSPRRI